MFDIYTDSCADLSPEILQKHNIHVIPLQVFIDGINFRDGEITTQELFERVEKSGQLPKTAAPALADFINRFTETANDVIFIGISSKLSATVETALLAAAEITTKKVYVVDSLNLSTGIGLQVLKAVDMREAGVPAPALVKYLQEHTEKVRASFVIDTMEYLYKGGRCTALQAMAGSMFSIRPIIYVYSDGTLKVRHKIRGAREKALNTLLADLKADLPNLDLHRAFVTHTGVPEDAAYLIKQIKAMVPFADVVETTAGATIGSHCGPGTIGILYMLN